MSDAVSIEFPHEDAKALFREMERARVKLGKSVKDSVRLGGWHLIRSIGAATKVSARTRPIVKNPHPNAGRDKRRANVGVMKYDRNGKQYFEPIYRTGEYGKTRYEADGSITIFSPDGTRENYTRDDFVVLNMNMPSVKNSKKRIIGRRGLAKGSWKWAGKHLGKGGGGRVMDVPNAVTIRWAGYDNDPSLTISNKLRYIIAAIRGREGAIAASMGKAARAMAIHMDSAISKSVFG